MIASNVLEPTQTDYETFISKIHGMVTFELMRELDKMNASMMFQSAGVAPTMEQIRAGEEIKPGVDAGLIQPIRFDRFMESSFVVPGNNASTSASMVSMMVKPVASSLADAVDRDVRELRKLPFFSAEPPVYDPQNCLASKCTKIFGELSVRSDLMSIDGKLSVTTMVLYGSAR